MTFKDLPYLIFVFIWIHSFFQPWREKTTKQAHLTIFTSDGENFVQCRQTKFDKILTTIRDKSKRLETLVINISKETNHYLWQKKRKIFQIFINSQSVLKHTYKLNNNTSNVMNLLLRTIAFPGRLGRWGGVSFPKLCNINML